MRYLIIIINLLVINSLHGQQTRPRTLYWSASTFTKNDSLKAWSFYLGNYMELSDTGEVIIMTRKMYQSPKEFYRISIPDSVKTIILDIATNTSIYAKPRKVEQEERPIYDGPTYTLRIRSGSMNKTISLIPPEANSLQRRLVQIMNDMIDNPTIIAKTEKDLTGYENYTEKEVLKHRGPLPKIGPPIQFIPPVIELDK